MELGRSMMSAAPALRELRGHRQQIGKSAALTVGALTLARAALRRRGTERSQEIGRVNLTRCPYARARRFQRAVRPSCAEQTDRLEPAVRLWSTSPFLFSGLLLAVWFGATIELGRSMMSAGAGAARVTGSSTTDRKTALTAIAIHIEDAGKTGVLEVVLHADEVDGEEIDVPKFHGRRFPSRPSLSRVWSRSRRRFVMGPTSIPIIPAITRGPVSKCSFGRARTCSATKMRNMPRPETFSAGTGRA